MACRLIGAKPLSEPTLDYCLLDSLEHISVKIELKSPYFQENVFENVGWKVAAILSRPQCV